MSTEVQSRLPENSNVAQWTPVQRAAMSQLGLVDRKNWKGPQPDAPAGVVEAFLQQCARTHLDPFARQIYAAEMGGKWTVLISIDGFRLIADRTGKYRGRRPTEWKGKTGDWVDVWLEDEPPAAARVSVLRSDFDEPLTAVATYAGYCPRDRKTGELKPTGQWGNNPSNQLAKCAEMLALRQAFPNELSGLYGTEEMDQARTHQGGESRKSSSQHRQQAPAPKVARLTASQFEKVKTAVMKAASSEDVKALYAGARQKGTTGELLPEEVYGTDVTLGDFLRKVLEEFIEKENAAAEKPAEPVADAAPAADEDGVVIEETPAETVDADAPWPEEVGGDGSESH